MNSSTNDPAGPLRHPRSRVPDIAPPDLDKHSKPLAAKDEVRPPWQWPVPAPAGDAVSVEDRYQPKFGVLVPRRADGGHDLRALCLRYQVRHTVSNSPIIADIADLAAAGIAERGARAAGRERTRPPNEDTRRQRRLSRLGRTGVSMQEVRNLSYRELAGGDRNGAP
jgi:hypothetical protein